MSKSKKAFLGFIAWGESLRFSVAILASLLALASFRVVESYPSAVILVTVFCIVSASMVQNDWRDRFHDVRKGKVLAHAHPKTFLLFACMLWGVTAGLIIRTFLESHFAGFLLVSLALISLLYSESRKIPFLPLFLVALASAGPALLGISKNNNWRLPLTLFFISFLIIGGREIVKDIEDFSVDHGYKWTIPLKIGTENARVLAALCWISSVAIASVVWMETWLGGVLIISAVCLLLRGKLTLARVLNVVDTGILGMMLGVILF